MLSDFIALLGEPVRRPDRRGWATWFCPFHNDTHTPNFGGNVVKGNWRCMTCGASGPSPTVLARRLGKNLSSRYYYQPRPQVELTPTPMELGEAIKITQDKIYLGRDYLYSRGIDLRTARRLGLGFGVQIKPSQVHLATIQAARSAGLINDDGYWRWNSGIIWAEPPENPFFVQIRTTRPERKLKYMTHGPIVQPAGSWLVPLVDPQKIILVEGLFDMIALNQVFLDEARQAVALAVLGTSPSEASARAIKNLTEGKEVIIVPDPDEGGKIMENNLKRILPEARVVFPPANLDPDEAVLEGWRPI